MANKSFYYDGITGGKKQVASLGAFSLVVFGLPLLIALLAHTQISPQWLLWFFYSGTTLGFVLLLSGLFAIDVPHRR